jgi:hypothetical protein
VGGWRCARAVEAGSDAIAALAARAVIGRKNLTKIFPTLRLDTTVPASALPADES